MPNFAQIAFGVMIDFDVDLDDAVESYEGPEADGLITGVNGFEEMIIGKVLYEVDNSNPKEVSIETFQKILETDFKKEEEEIRANFKKISPEFYDKYLEGKEFKLLQYVNWY